MTVDTIEQIKQIQNKHSTVTQTGFSYFKIRVRENPRAKSRNKKTALVTITLYSLYILVLLPLVSFQYHLRVKINLLYGLATVLFVSLRRKCTKLLKDYCISNLTLVKMKDYLQQKVLMSKVKVLKMQQDGPCITNA